MSRLKSLLLTAAVSIALLAPSANAQRFDLRLGKKALRQFQETVPAFRKALEEGYRDFDAVNRKVGKL